ncbi:MAG: DNA polymerase I [Deltaproteobacteria bacterium]|nr:DNA polymerase I [Deltaproteobacteria bacterium]
MSRKKLYLIDGNSYIYRAYFAIPYLSNSKGLPTNAIYGFTNMLMKVIKEESPDYLAIAFDSKGPTRRHIEFEDYKAHRPAMPDPLSRQIPYIHRMVEAFNIPVLIMEGVEADDIIGTIARKAEKDGMEVIIITGDKDIFQIISPHIKIYDTLKNKYFGIDDVKERFGTDPERVVEVMGLMGDSSDNIPGVPGIGEKTAKALIEEYGTIENLLNNLEKIKKPKLKESLRENTELARLSRSLATIQTDIPIETEYKELSISKPDNEKLFPLLKELEFTAMLKMAAPEVSVKEHLTLEPDMAVEKLRGEGEIAMKLISDDPDPMKGKIDGIALAKKGEAFYIPVVSGQWSVVSQIFEGELIKVGHDLKKEMILLKRAGIGLTAPLFDTMVASYLINPVRSEHTLEGIDLEFLGKNVMEQGADEKSRIDSACHAAEAIFELREALSERLRDEGLEDLFYKVEMPLVRVLADIEMTGVKVNKEFLVEMSKEVDIDLQTIMGKIYSMAGQEFNINSPQQLSEILFDKLGLPVIKRTKSGDTANKELQALVKEIYSLAGFKYDVGVSNLLSKKGLFEELRNHAIENIKTYDLNDDELRVKIKKIDDLFDKIILIAKKAKAGSTDVEVLQQLSAVHELPAEILTYRTLTKLKSTYIDSLPSMINPDTGRVHTSLNQTVTATGRLSSSEPNLQNIPIRTELGKRIREAFIAEPGNLIISADYSQIELRVMAHMSEDPILIESFKRGEDIHSRTAAEVFGIMPGLVTAEMRRMAKVVNFGIIYGMSPFGLSKDLGISQRDAKRYIDAYFEHYKGVSAFIEKTLQEARGNGYVRTLLGRKRPMPELSSKEAAVRQFGERTAVNTPIQGTAADIIKLAMVNIFNRIRKENLKSLMTLQVHDELVFEVPENELEVMKQIVREEMEGVIELKVPLKVDIGVGKNWSEAH